MERAGGAGGAGAGVRGGGVGEGVKGESRRPELEEWGQVREG